MEKIKDLSILVAAYNVEMTLENCILSLIKQDIPIESYEIIIVNDGSTDNTLIIANHLASNNSNIKVISQENKKLSGARKTGLKNANGRYIMFIDGDDYLKENCLQFLIQKISDFKLDILSFCFESVNEEGKKIPQEIRPVLESSIMYGNEFMFSKYMKNNLAGNIIRKDLFTENEIILADGINKGEDKFVTYQLFYFALNVKYIPNRFYYYVRDNQKSICNTMSINSFLDLFYVLHFLYQFAKEKVKENHIKQKYFHHLNMCIVDAFYYLSSFVVNQSEYNIIFENIIKFGLLPIEENNVLNKKNKDYITFLNNKHISSDLFRLKKIFRVKKNIQKFKVFINKYTYQLREYKQ